MSALTKQDHIEQQTPVINKYNDSKKGSIFASILTDEVIKCGCKCCRNHFDTAKRMAENF